MLIYFSVSLLQNNFSSSESTLTGYKIEIDNLKKQLEEADKHTCALKVELDAANVNLLQQQAKVTNQVLVAKADQVSFTCV